MSSDRPQDSDKEKDLPQSTGKGPQPQRQASSGGGSERKKAEQPRRQKPNNFNRTPRMVRSKEESLNTVSPMLGSASMSYAAEVLSAVEAVSEESPGAAYRRIEHDVNASVLFNYFAEVIYRYAEARSPRQELQFSEDDLRLTFRYVLASRICQVSNVRLPVRPGEVRYPSVLGPLLAAIGRYVHPTAAYEIVPTLNPEHASWSGLLTIKDKGCEEGLEQQKVQWSLLKPAVVDRVITALRGYGMPDNIGLPVDVVIDNDAIFRLDDNHEMLLKVQQFNESNPDNQISVPEELTGSGDFAPSATTILNRAFVEMATLASIYGQHRVVYNSISTLYGAVDRLAYDAFVMK